MIEGIKYVQRQIYLYCGLVDSGGTNLSCQLIFKGSNLIVYLKFQLLGQQYNLKGNKYFAPPKTYLLFLLQRDFQCWLHISEEASQINKQNGPPKWAYNILCYFPNSQFSVKYKLSISEINLNILIKNQMLNFDSDSEIKPQPYFQYEPVQLIEYPLFFEDEALGSAKLFDDLQIPANPQIDYADSYLDKQEDKNKQNSPNLLKNIVSILKTWGNLGDSATNDAKTVWDYFLTAKKVNHQLIKAVFGVWEETVGDIQKLQKQSPELFSNNDLLPEKLIATHQWIREKIVLNIRQADISYIVKNRRVKNPQHFEKNFRAFIDTIERGGVSRNFKISKLAEEEKQIFRTNTSYKD